MNVTLKVDVLTPNNGVGRAGQTVTMPDAQGKQYIDKGLADEAGPDVAPLPPDPKPKPAKAVTRETVKPGADRETKPADKPTETK